jgi:acyl-CoA ligase (AMP-forming) (exosortase A-associated)
MKHATLLTELILHSAQRRPDAAALTYGHLTLNYGELAQAVEQASSAFIRLGLHRGERVAVYLEKSFETVVACFGAALAGVVCVPVNPLLRPEQVAYILRDCNVRIVVTSNDRFGILKDALDACPDLHHVVAVGADQASSQDRHYALHTWDGFMSGQTVPGHRVIDTDLAAILYTSGSTGRPKGVLLSHRNMVAGARSVASYLENRSDDTLLAALPFSFDAGFSQLTTAFHVGARVALLNYLLPIDVIKAIKREHVTGLTAVPPLYIQLAQLDWPSDIAGHLRYFANTGGRMPRDTLSALRQRLPKSKPFLMYGLTEAFRSTYLPPEEVDRRPDSIGKAIPNVEILVLRKDGSPCAPREQGELVHRGALVGMGYWNDPEKTAERFKPLPSQAPSREPGMVLPEIAVFSGDTVFMDEEGFLYFVGRHDDMIKTSGYRVSPMEVEEIVYGTRLVGECVAFGIDHPILGQVIHVIATPPVEGNIDAETLSKECRKRMPSYMVPAVIDIRPGPLPRSPNGKFDRKSLAAEAST